MYTTDPTEARIHDAGNILVAPPIPPLRDFFGSVITPEDLASSSPDLAQKTVYLCGDIARINARQLHAADRVFVIRDLSHKFEIPLTHHSFIAFSVDANRLLRHRIVLDKPVPTTENTWLGLTFRTSKTVIRFPDGHPHLPQGARLTSADDDQRREFYRLRRRENQETDFTYPPLTYTVSESDLLPPT